MSNPPLPLLALPPELRNRIYGHVFADPKQRSLRHPLRHVSKATHDEVTLMILQERFLTICLRSRYFERQVLIQPSIFLPGDHHIRTSWLEFKKSLLSPWIRGFKATCIEDHDCNIRSTVVFWPRDCYRLVMEWHKGVPGPKRGALASSCVRFLQLYNTWPVDDITVARVELSVRAFRDIVQSESETIFGGHFYMT